MDMSNDFGMMLHDKIRAETKDFSTLSDFDRFVLDRGYYYKTEAELNAAYARAKKTGRGELVTKAEFDAEMRRDHADRLYDVLAELVAKGILTPGELFAYARYGWCANAPESVIYYQTGAGKYVVNNCDTQIPEAEAIVKVCREWGFEASRVKIIGTSYYDSTDWQFIRFDCAAMTWLWANETLYMVYK